MNLGIRPVTLMRTLLSRGGLVGVMLLAVLVLGHSASPQHALLAQSASITLAIPETRPELEPTPRQLARLLATHRRSPRPYPRLRCGGRCDRGRREFRRRRASPLGPASGA